VEGRGRLLLIPAPAAPCCSLCRFAAPQSCRVLMRVGPEGALFELALVQKPLPTHSRIIASSFLSSKVFREVLRSHVAAVPVRFLLPFARQPIPPCGDARAPPFHTATARSEVARSAVCTYFNIFICTQADCRQAGRPEAQDATAALASSQGRSDGTRQRARCYHL
jgi:hypothetical protein